jgi:hypothetical protein
MSYKAYRLTEKERTYLETGEPPGTYTPAEIEQRIEEKIELISDRFEHLSNDVELLREEGYLDVESWASGWLELMDVELPEAAADDGLRDAFTRKSSEKEWYTHATPPGEFGYEVGDMLYHLMLLPRGVNREDVYLDLAWGVVQGIYWFTDEHTYEGIKRLEERSQRKLKADDRLSQFADFAEQMGDLGDEIDDRIEEILKSEGIEPTPGLVREIHNEAENEREELPFMVWGSGEEAIVEAYTPELVNEVIEEKRILEKRQMREIVEDDAELLDEKAGSPSARAVLLDLLESENEVDSSGEVASRLNENKDWTSRVTTVARDLAGVKNGNAGWKHRDIWDDRPVVEGDRDGWKTTAYGEVVAEYLQANDTPLSRFGPRFLISEDTLVAALDELDE